MSVCTYLNLPLHGDAKEHDEVHYKYRPEYWHIEGIKKCANHGDDDAFCRWMPEKKSSKLSKNNVTVKVLIKIRNQN